MKYIVLDQRAHEGFTKEFDSKEAAIAECRNQWNCLTAADKKDVEFFGVIESVNPDEEAENHMDGDVVIDMGIWFAAQRDSEDDWGTGAYTIEEALTVAEQMKATMITKVIGYVNQIAEEEYTLYAIEELCSGARMRYDDRYLTEEDAQKVIDSYIAADDGRGAEYFIVEA